MAYEWLSGAGEAAAWGEDGGQIAPGPLAVAYTEWIYRQVGNPLSYDAWATSELRRNWGLPHLQSPDNYDWIILGEYYGAQVGGGRAWIFDMLRQLGQAAEMPADYDWTPGLAVAAKNHWAQTNQPFRYLETPNLAPIVGAAQYALAEYPALAPFIKEIAPGSQMWADSLAAANARRDAHKESIRQMNIMIVAVIATMGAAAYFAPVAGAAGSGAAIGAGETAAILAAEDVAMAAAISGEAFSAGALSLELASELSAAEWGAGLELELGSLETLAAATPAQTSMLSQAAEFMGMDSLESALVSQGKSMLATEVKKALAPKPIARAPSYLSPPPAPPVVQSQPGGEIKTVALGAALAALGLLFLG